MEEPENRSRQEATMTASTDSTFVRCGNTKAHGSAWLNGVENAHHHGSAAEVKACFATPGGLPSAQDVEAQAHAEWETDTLVAAEAANERWFEERGGGQYVGSEEEARDRWLDSLHEEETLERERRAEEAAQAAASPKSFIESFTAAYAAGEETDGEPAEPTTTPFVRPSWAKWASEGPSQTSAPSAEPASPGSGVQDVLPSAEPSLDQDLLDGIYTLPQGGGHRTFRLRTQADDAKFAPGKRVLQYLSGQDNDSDYTGFAFVTGRALKVWAKHRDNVALVEAARSLLADPAVALVAAQCRRCHRTLTVPSSIDAGLGPDCAKKA